MATLHFDVEAGDENVLIAEVEERASGDQISANPRLLLEFEFFDEHGETVTLPVTGLSKKTSKTHLVLLQSQKTQRRAIPINFIVPANACRLAVGSRTSNTDIKITSASLRSMAFEPNASMLADYVELKDDMVSDGWLARLEGRLFRQMLALKVAEARDQFREELEEAVTWEWQSRYILDRIAATLFQLQLRTAPDAARAEQYSYLDTRFGLPSWHIFAGGIKFRNSQYADAYEHFRQAATSDLSMTRNFEGAYSVRPYDQFLDWHKTDKAILPAVSALRWHDRPPRDGKFRIVFGCDAHYFLNIAEDVIASLSSQKSQALIHFHVVNWNEECAALAETINASFSSETGPDEIGWYITNRFFRAAELMDGFQGPIMIADIDIDFVAPPETILDYEYDVALDFMHYDYLPWFSPRGSCSYIAYTQYGRLFAEDLNKYVRDRFQWAPHRSFWFDMLMLNEVCRSISLRALPTKIGHVGRSTNPRAAENFIGIKRHPPYRLKR